MGGNNDHNQQNSNIEHRYTIRKLLHCDEDGRLAKDEVMVRIDVSSSSQSNIDQTFDSVVVLFH